jgi:hypothetical protein
MGRTGSIHVINHVIKLCCELCYVVLVVNVAFDHVLDHA